MATIDLPCPVCGATVAWEAWRVDRPFMTMCCGAIVRLIADGEAYSLEETIPGRVAQSISPESQE